MKTNIINPQLESTYEFLQNYPECQKHYIKLENSYFSSSLDYSKDVNIDFIFNYGLIYQDALCSERIPSVILSNKSLKR